MPGWAPAGCLRVKGLGLEGLGFRFKGLGVLNSTP